MDPKTNLPSKIRVIHTHGTDREMGAEHARLLGSTVNQGMIHFFSRLWKHLTNPKGKSLVGRAFLATFNRHIAPMLKYRLIRQIPDFARERLQGMADEAGLSVEELYGLVVLPDFGPVLQAIQSQFFPGRFVEFQPPSFGCSSYFVGGENFYFGRNLDFPGIGYWDRFPVIQKFAPNGGLKYLGFTSAGIPFAGISGVNEAQVAVALHQHYTNRYSWDGELPFFIGEKVLRQARNIDEAIEVIAGCKVASAWAFLIADGKSQEAAVIEALPDRRGVRRWKVSDNPLAHSNYLVSEECRSCETSASARMTWDNYYRRETLMKRLSRIGDGFTPAIGVRLLGDGWDPFWNEEKILNRVVSQNYNIKSMLLNLSQMRVWMAENDAPPVHLGSYREFDLNAILSGESGETGKMLPGFRYGNQELDKAKKYLIEAYIASNEGNEILALEKLNRVLEINFIPEVAHVRGVLLLQKDEGFAALSEFRRAQKWIDDKMIDQGKRQHPPEYFESMLFEARALDVVGDRAAAIRTYQKLAQHPGLQDTNLRKVASRAKRYSSHRARAIIMPFSTYVPFQ